MPFLLKDLVKCIYLGKYCALVLHEFMIVPENFSENLLRVANKQYELVWYLNSNDEIYHDRKFKTFDEVFAFGNLGENEAIDNQAVLENLLNNFDYKFGFFAYDFKNQLENLTSKNAATHQFPDFYFFIPQLVVFKKNNTVWCRKGDQLKWNVVKTELQKFSATQTKYKIPIVEFIPKVTKANYLKNFQKIRHHIQRGDIYEMNYCVEFVAQNVKLNPLETYFLLNKKSPNPFSGFVKFGHKYLLCASPERFLKKEGQRLISQPIKGTSPRFSDIKADLKSKHELLNSPKNQSENVMIVDLVRNDLSKSAEKNSVQVSELFGIYEFPQVYQMISTIESIAKPQYTALDLIKQSFPMGSMTGAPKIRAMQIIDEIENSKRELFSGSIGYFDEKNNFDFNVIIRSLFYNSSTKTLSFMVGGAITAQSVAEEEYQECLLKGKAIFELFEK